jgi:DNA-directed RNA polymerase subunit RPC12/RpoP
MGFKRLKCPVCGQKVSFFWNYFSFPPIVYTCSNCKTRIKWRQIIRLYSLISGIIMFSIFFIIRDYIGSPYIALIIGFIPAQIFFLIILQKVKPIIKDKEKKI